MKRTEHYDLPTWEMSDRVLMSDFNDMTGKIDTALQRLSDNICTGSYTGDGSSGRIITLPWTPKLLLVSGHYPAPSGYSDGFFTVVFGEHGHEFRPSSSYPGGTVKIVENGFSLNTEYHNVLGKEEAYIAIR